MTDELVTLYAIGALDAREAADFERQLAQSPQLRARVAEEKAAATALFASVEPIVPSPMVKQRLMSRIGPADLPPQLAQPKAGLGDVWRWLLGGLSVGFAALAVVFGVSLLNTQSQVGQLQTQVAQLQTQTASVQGEMQAATDRAAQLERDLAAAQSAAEQAQTAAATAQAGSQQAEAGLADVQAKAQHAQDALAQAQAELGLLSRANVRSASIPANNDTFQDGAVTVFFAPKSNSALITVANLPALAADQDYQVWLIKDGKALPSSVFDTAVTGDGRLIVTSDEPFEAYQSVGITIEPSGGRPTPNPAGPIFLGPLS